jgi:hypothetical protein
LDHLPWIQGLKVELRFCLAANLGREKGEFWRWSLEERDGNEINTGF